MGLGIAGQRCAAGLLDQRDALAALCAPTLNSYKRLAATLAAGLDGIDRELPPPEPCSDHLYQRHTRGEPLPPRLPRDLRAACAVVRRDPARRRGADSSCSSGMRHGTVAPGK